MIENRNGEKNVGKNPFDYRSRSDSLLRICKYRPDIMYYIHIYVYIYICNRFKFNSVRRYIDTFVNCISLNSCIYERLWTLYCVIAMFNPCTSLIISNRYNRIYSPLIFLNHYTSWEIIT